MIMFTITSPVLVKLNTNISQVLFKSKDWAYKNVWSQAIALFLEHRHANKCRYSICTIYTSGPQRVVRGPHLPGGLRTEATYLFFKNINTQTDQFWKLSRAQFSVVVRNCETKFVSGPQVSKG